jgi:hypothetical protein
VAPPVTWRPAQVVPAASPRELPEQEHAAIDEAEAAAHRFTVATGAAAAIALGVMVIALCGQLIPW